MPSLSKVVCLCAAPTPVAFSAGSIAAAPPLEEKEEEEERSGAVARAAAAAAFPNQPVRPSPSLAPSAVRRLRPKGAAPLLPSVQSSPFFFPE